MQIKLAQCDGYFVARLEGPLDESAREQFREQLHPLVGRRGTRLVLDLSATPRINSPGIGNLVALVADANTQGSRVVLCGLTQFVAGVLAVTKLDQYFELADTVAEAAEKFAQPL